jgi:hypothetical protein
MRAASYRRHAIVGWLLFGLFAFRVVAQPLSLVVDAGLPSFESWHSATLPYGVLLASQVLILLAMGWANHRLRAGLLEPRRSIGFAALTFGGIYFAAMVARLVLGLTVLSHSRWFASAVPTVFHLVLAGWLLVYGHFHLSFAAERSSRR